MFCLYTTSLWFLTCSWKLSILTLLPTMFFWAGVLAQLRSWASYLTISNVFVMARSFLPHLGWKEFPCSAKNCATVKAFLHKIYVFAPPRLIIIITYLRPWASYLTNLNVFVMARSFLHHLVWKEFPRSAKNCGMLYVQKKRSCTKNLCSCASYIKYYYHVSSSLSTLFNQLTRFCDGQVILIPSSLKRIP